MPHVVAFRLALNVDKGHGRGTHVRDDVSVPKEHDRIPLAGALEGVYPVAQVTGQVPPEDKVLAHWLVFTLAPAAVAEHEAGTHCRLGRTVMVPARHV